MTSTATVPDFPALKEAKGKLDAKRKELADIFQIAGDDIDLSKVIQAKHLSGARTTHDVSAKIRELNDEATELGEEVDNLVGVQKAAQRARASDEVGGSENGDGADQSGGTGNGAPRSKSFGQLFVESDAYKLKTGPIGPEATIDVDLKTLMTTSAGWAPEVTRTDRLVEFATRPIQVAELIPQTTTSQSAVQYMEETTFTNAAAETAEGGTYQEAALAYTEQTSLVRKIAVFLPVTDEQLEDEPRIRGVIDNRLPFMVRQRLDLQILTGNGTAPNLRGILNVVGIQTQAKGTDPVPDAVYKAIVKVEVTGQAMANAAVFHPNDWQDVRLLRTADGLYIWGNPSDAGPERIWGLRVVRAQALTENTGLVGDFANFSELSVRRGIDVQISNSHSTYFVEGKQAIRADMRAALVIYRPVAFCTVTGI
jgi:HK97 family phage major capsid protein